MVLRGLSEEFRQSDVLARMRIQVKLTYRTFYHHVQQRRVQLPASLVKALIKAVTA